MNFKFPPKFKNNNMIRNMTVIIGCHHDPKSVSWFGNPCNANKLWAVDVYKNPNTAFELCKRLNERVLNCTRNYYSLLNI
jgi:hypothetical protein